MNIYLPRVNGAKNNWPLSDDWKSCLFILTVLFDDESELVVEDGSSI